MKDKIIKNKYLIAIIIIILLSCGWLITKGLPWAHDIHFHCTRIGTLAKTIQSGDFLALIHSSYNGYGYATGLFYSNFFFYIPSLLTLIGLSEVVAYKVFLILINIVTTIITYFASKSILKDKKYALFTTAIYMFANYRLVDIFVRGAIGEVLAFMFLPLVILGLYEIIYRDFKKWYIFTIGFVLLILSHLISTILIAVFSVIIILINYKRFLKEKERLKYLIISGVVGLLLGGFFVFPMLEQYLYGNISIFKEGSYFLPGSAYISFLELLVPTNISNCYIGVVLMLLMPIRLFYKKNSVDEKYKDLISFADILLILGLIVWIFTTKIFPWKLLENQLSFIQFPWRLLLVSTIFMSISAGINMMILVKEKDNKIAKKIYTVALTISVLLILVFSLQYGIRKNQYNSFPRNHLGTGEYLPAYTDRELLEENKIYSNNEDIIINYNKTGTAITVSYSNNYKDSYIEVPLLNYLGYYATNGYKVINGSNNVIRINITKESDNFTVYYKGTIIQKVSYILSGITLVGLSLYTYKIKKRH